jgi:hypothetical protein
MPMTACTIGAVALLLLALEDGDRPIAPLVRGTRWQLDARHAVLGLAGAAVLAQAAYYAAYFTRSPLLGVGGAVPPPELWLPLAMALALAAQSRDGWLILRAPAVLGGAVIAAIVNEPIHRRAPGQSRWRHAIDDLLGPAERHAIDRYAIRAIAFPLVAVVAGRGQPHPAGLTSALREAWRRTGAVAERAIALRPITTMRQVYLLAMYALLAISVLAKGPPGLTVVAGVIALRVACCREWRDVLAGGLELKRGALLMIAIAVPWHVAMYLKAGPAFVNEYLLTHILSRASAGVDNSPGSFEFYTSQIGHGMWLWAALLPAALGAALARARTDSREARVRFTVALWAIAAVAVFCLVQTKFHHYILPAIPPLALVVAMFLDDVVARRDRLHPLYAALAAGIALLVCRDLVAEPERWIEMFVFRYDRPWPAAEPYSIDVSDPLIALGLAGAASLLVLGTRFARLGAVLVGGCAVAICLWALRVYMPIAATHWGMREAMRTYYAERTIYGQQLIYFGLDQLLADWGRPRDTWSFETAVPRALQLGQPMALRIQVFDPDAERALQREVTLAGAVSAIGPHRVTIALAPSARAALEPHLADARAAATATRPPAASGPAAARRDPRRARLRARQPIYAVDADRLLAWQLYWRGELFWSGGEIWAWPAEQKTYFGNTNNVQLLKYLGDATRAPRGRRYFVLTEASRLLGLRGILPTPRARDSLEPIDLTSNKFSLGAFTL